MANRAKEEEKYEKIIRNLLKQSGNKRCINCGSLGPQYVCTTFSIFVCTACSGVHREFSHRVKSVSMAKFTAAEVADLQAGGNEHARAIYFKEWDPQRNPLPDNSNPDKLRSFIKNVYEEKRYTGEKSAQRGRQNDRDDLEYPKRYESHSTSRSVPQSPSYEERYEDRSLNNRTGARNRGIRQLNNRYSDEDVQFDPKRSPGRYDHDREHDHNRYSDGRDHRFEDRFSSRELQEGRKSDAARKEPEGRQPHIAYVKDNYRSSASQKNGFPRLALAPVDSRKTSKNIPSLESSAIGQPSVTAAPASTLTRADSFSLIDFNAEPEIPVEAVSTNSTALTPLPSSATAASSDGGWANFDTFTTAEAPSMTISSNNVNEFFTSTNVGSQKVEFSAPTRSMPGPGADNWASFGENLQPLPLPSPYAELNVLQVSSISNQPAPQQLQFPQEDKKVLTNSSTNVHPSGKRQPIPEELFFSPSPASASANMGLGIQTLERPSLGAFPQGVFPSYGPPPYSQFSTSGNPFDLPGDFSSQTVKNDMFPNLGSLQASLPSAVNSEGISKFSTSTGPRNLSTAQLPYLAAVPPAASYSGGTSAFGEVAPSTVPENHFGGNGTAMAGNYGLFHAQTLYSQSSLPAASSNPFG